MRFWRGHQMAASLLTFAGALGIGSGIACLMRHGPTWLAALLIAAGVALMAPDLISITWSVRRIRAIRAGLYCFACLKVGAAGLRPAGRRWLCADEAACLERAAERKKTSA